VLPTVFLRTCKAFPPIVSRHVFEYDKSPKPAKRDDKKDIMKCLFQFAKDDQGQDLIEYALMAGFVAVAAGALMPSVSSSISKSVQ